MSIANELTSEVTDFMLINEELSNARNLQQLLLVFHTTLRSLSLEERQRRRARLSSEFLTARDKSAAIPAH